MKYKLFKFVFLFCILLYIIILQSYVISIYYTVLQYINFSYVISIYYTVLQYIIFQSYVISIYYTVLKYIILQSYVISINIIQYYDGKRNRRANTISLWSQLIRLLLFCFIIKIVHFTVIFSKI